MKNHSGVINKTIDYTQYLLFGTMALLLLIEIIFSFGWRMQHDSPLLHYVAFLIGDEGFVPYRDVFETSMPGTFLMHLTIGKVFGYSDLAFRIVDIFFLLILLYLTWTVMRSFGKWVAVSSILLFGLLYIGYGPNMSLQRDYVGIIPIVLSLVIMKKDIWSSHIKALVLGGLFALSASVKPHLAIGLPALLIFMVLYDRQEEKVDLALFIKRLFRIGLFATGGFIVILSIPFLWLWSLGGLPAFWEMFSSYLPLHIQLSGKQEMITGAAKLKYMISLFIRFGELRLIFIPITLGLYLSFAFFAKSQKMKWIVLLFILFLLYIIYPVFAGQFWTYHWMPFAYFGCLMASLVMIPADKEGVEPYKRIIPLAALILFMLFTIRPAGDFVDQISGKGAEPPKEGRVDEVADFLIKNVKPGDKVQPLDWTGGALHGMLIARSVVATPYIYDYHFYHHVSNPYIQEVRTRFVSLLQKDPPRFIVNMYAKNIPSGEDTSTDFPALKSFLSENYRSVYLGNDFEVFESVKR